METVWLIELKNEITKKIETKKFQEFLDESIAFADNGEFSFESFKEIYLNILLNHFNSKVVEFEKEILIDFFTFLHFSILSGEYFQNNFNDNIDEIISILGKFQYQELDENISEEILLPVQSKFFEIEFLSILKKSLIEYKSTSNHLIRLVENPSLNTLFDLSDQADDILNELKENSNPFTQKDDLKKELFISIKNNLFLARKDFCLMYNVDDIKKILICRNEIKKCISYFAKVPIISETLNILEEKCLFLIRKFITRKNREENVLNENYVFLGTEQNFDYSSHKLSLEIFKKWDKYSRIHFGSEHNSKYELSIKKEAISILKIGKLTSLDFHLLTKYFKDLEINTLSLRKLLSNIDEIPHDQNIPFDKYSFNKIKNYISNNNFSRSIDDLDIKLDIESIKQKINIEIEFIENLQKESFINNFFPYYKVSHFLKNYIIEIEKEISLKNEYSLMLINKIKESNQLLIKYYSEYKKNLNWSKIHLNYAFQQPFDECLSEPLKISNKYEIKVFCPSTFSLPIDYTFFDDFIKETDSFILRIQNDIINLGHIYDFVESFNITKNEINNEIKDNSKKNIELLGIFSAIIALLFQGAYTSQSNTTFENKFLTFIIMFVVLAFFLIMLRAFISNKKERNEDLLSIRVSLYLITPILLIIIYILFKHA